MIKISATIAIVLTLKILFLYLSNEISIKYKNIRLIQTTKYTKYDLNIISQINFGIFP